MAYFDGSDVTITSTTDSNDIFIWSITKTSPPVDENNPTITWKSTNNDEIYLCY